MNSINLTDTGQTLPTKSQLATRDGFGQGLTEAAIQNPQVVGLCADVTESLRMTDFAQKFPQRFIQVGVAEQNLVGTAAGLALRDKIPFAASFAVFNPGRSWDQIRVSVAYSNLNVKIVGGHAGLSTGPDGATHQALEDIALMRVLPNMTVVVPADAKEAQQAVLALTQAYGPAYLRLSREKTPQLADIHWLDPTATAPLQLGKVKILYQTKDQHHFDVTIIACGLMVHRALSLAKLAQQAQLSIQIINCHTIKPLDEAAIITAAEQSNLILTMEEHQQAGGLGSAIAECLLSAYGKTLERLPRIEIAGVDDQFGESGETDWLLDKYLPSQKQLLKLMLAVRAKESPTTA